MIYLIVVAGSDAIVDILIGIDLGDDTFGSRKQALISIGRGDTMLYVAPTVAFDSCIEVIAGSTIAYPTLVAYIKAIEPIAESMTLAKGAFIATNQTISSIAEEL